MKQVLNKAKVIAAFIMAIAYLGCEDVTNMFPDVTSAFTYTINEDTGTVTFLNISEDADNYQWDFGDGSTSTEINPIKTYAESGTYTVTLRAVNLAGASDSSQDQVSVTITPVGGGGGDCTEETAQSLDATDFNLTFQADPGSAIVEDGAAFSVIDNPDTDNDVNSSCKVGEIVRDASLPFANNQIEFDSKFDFTANAGFKLKVWAPVAGTNVLLKLEDKTDSGINTEVAAVTVSGNAWEELTFDFPDTESGKYDKIVLFFDINTDSGATYYIDDFALYGEGGGAGECTAETSESLSAADFNLTFQTDPGSAIIEDGAAFSYIDNPDTDNAVNPSCKVGEIVRDASLPFANNQIEFDSKFDFSANSGFKLKVWAPVAGTNVLLKLEDKTDAGINTEVGAVTVSGNAWEELTFDFPDTESGKYDKIVLFFDINTDSGATYYIDDFALNSGGDTGGTNGCSDTLIAATALPVDFEGCETFLSSANFGDGITSELTENPSKTGINTSDFVLQVDKPTGSSFFAGIQNTFASNFDLTTDNVFKIKIYSTKADAIFRFELLADPNDGSIGNPSPVYATVPNANEWTEVEFVFTNLPAAPTAYNQLVIKPDNDQSDSPIDNGATYYFDDLTLNAPSGGGSLEDCGGDLVNDFETADDSIFNNFGGGVGTIIDNPDTSVNTSAKVAQYVKGAGEVFAGITMEVDPDIDFNAGVFSIDVSSQAVRQLLFKLEGLNIEQVIPTSGTGWETITYDFSAAAGNIGSVTAITLIMDNGTAGDGSADWTIQFDNVRLCSNETSGGGSSLEDCGGDLVNDFETADDSIFNNFGGGVGTIIDNPDTSVNTSAKVAQYVKGAGEVFAGITMEVDPDIDFNAGVFSIDVSSQAVRQLLFKLEGLNIEQVIPTSGTGWETITYDFSAAAGNIGSVTAITLIMDNGTAGDGSADWTIQFDNVRLCSNETSGGGSSLEDCGGDLVNDFETADDSIFNNFGGGVGTIIDNPDTSVNTSAKVAQYVKGAGEVFAGITMEVDPDIDFNAGVFSIDVSSQAVRQLLFKLEGLNIEQVIPTSGTGWETITYDFSAAAGNIGSVTAITLIMDNGTAGDGSADWTIQFDNVRLCSNETSGGGGSGSNLAADGDFESGVADPWLLFANGGTAAFDNTINNGGTWSGRLATSGPSNPALKQERIGAGTVAATDVVQIQFDHIGSVVQPGAVFNVILFGEGAAGASFTHVFSPAPTLSGTWTTFTGTYAIPGGTDVSEGISFLIEAVCGGDAGCSVSANIDNVSVTLNP